MSRVQDSGPPALGAYLRGVRAQPQIRMADRPRSVRRNLDRSRSTGTWPGFLAKYRGYGIGTFVRSNVLAGCDYWVPDLGLIVEFDESQHFTRPRKLALAVYANTKPLGVRREALAGALRASRCEGTTLPRGATNNEPGTTHCGTSFRRSCACSQQSGSTPPTKSGARSIRTARRIGSAFRT